MTTTGALPDPAEGALDGATASDCGICTLDGSSDPACTWPSTLLPGSRTATVATRITDDGVAASLLDTASVVFAGMSSTEDGRYLGSTASAPLLGIS